MITPVIWAIVTIIWIFNLGMNISADAPQELILLQCATAISSCAAAVVNYIRYRRSRQSD
jgi:hypothetical protein